MRLLLISVFSFVGLILPALSVPSPADDAAKTTLPVKNTIETGEITQVDANANGEEDVENRILLGGLLGMKQALLGGVGGGYGGYRPPYHGGYRPPHYGGYRPPYYGGHYRPGYHHG
ncbi:uncharacterized protein LOC136026127 [Artemia franciscana]|uniref:Uncharacterized protein n=1 Tax=Artemia franciscana TaxID=6661 RepID=A0AA88HTZ1_ARTSF|nr:hypothetical protein QYM36_012251 [Artemia franciscana]